MIIGYESDDSKYGTVKQQLPASQMLPMVKSENDDSGPKFYWEAEMQRDKRDRKPSAARTP